MQSHYPFEFEREMGCTEAELRAWLPAACEERAIEWRTDGATITLAPGSLSLRWHGLSPRRIALVELPRLRVRFAAHGIEATAWQKFMRRFDLHMQRGGG